MSNQFCLKWNNYQLSLTTAFKHILEAEDFVDVTLSAESQNLKAHRVVLSACSSYFRILLKGISPWQHPVLVLKDVPYLDLQSILEFVYLGTFFTLPIFVHRLKININKQKRIGLEKSNSNKKTKNRNCFLFTRFIAFLFLFGHTLYQRKNSRFNILREFLFVLLKVLNSNL